MFAKCDFKIDYVITYKYFLFNFQSENHRQQKCLRTQMKCFGSNIKYMVGNPTGKQQDNIQKYITMNSALIIPYCADTEVGMIAATVIPNNTKTPVKLIRFLLFFLLLN